MQTSVKILVTVGTTKFDEMVKMVDEIIPKLRSMQNVYITCQIGNGTYQPQNADEFYKISENFDECLSKQDIIISHAGAGSILSSLRAKKKLIVIINPRLMGNHQLEIADKCKQMKCCEVISVMDSSILLKAIENVQKQDYALLPEANTQYVSKAITRLIN